jgi:hypothetical protein
MGQKQTHAAQQKGSLFGSPRRRGRHSDAQRLGSFEVDHQLEFGCLDHRQFGGLLAFEGAIDVASA